MILKISEIEVFIGKLFIVFDDSVLLYTGFGEFTKEKVEELFPGRRLEYSTNNIYVKQIRDYFRKNRRYFSLPYKFSGTNFQQKVWAQTARIKYGNTATYKQIACKISNPHSARAVGNALHNNPLPIIIPCHRVIRTDGSLGGFGGGKNLKSKLIKFEKQRNN